MKDIPFLDWGSVDSIPTIVLMLGDGQAGLKRTNVFTVNTQFANDCI